MRLGPQQAASVSSSHVLWTQASRWLLSAPLQWLAQSGQVCSKLLLLQAVSNPDPTASFAAPSTSKQASEPRGTEQPQSR